MNGWPLAYFEGPASPAKRLAANVSKGNRELINAHLCRFAHFAASEISLRLGARGSRFGHVPKYDDHT